MKREEILSTIYELSLSQGFYGRLYRDIHDDDETLEYLESQNFGNPLDLILFLEC